jgi:hypothetical protein
MHIRLQLKGKRIERINFDNLANKVVNATGSIALALQPHMVYHHPPPNDLTRFTIEAF